MLTEKEKEWTERQLKKYFGYGMFMSCEDFLAHPWFETYSNHKLEKLKEAVQNARWSHYWKCAPIDSKFEPFTIYASDCAEFDVARVKNQYIANYLIKAQPVEIDSLIDYLDDYRDAAEFEARVAHKATSGYPLLNCRTCKYRSHKCHRQGTKLSGHWCVLKHARLTVEAEMEPAQ